MNLWHGNRQHMEQQRTISLPESRQIKLTDALFKFGCDFECLHVLTKATKNVPYSIVGSVEQTVDRRLTVLMQIVVKGFQNTDFNV